MTQAPKPVGAYTPVVRAGDWLIVSGQVGMGPNGQMVSGGTAGELRQAITNLGAQLATEGARLDQVVKTTVFLRHMSDYNRMNEVYIECFGDHRPARSAVGVAELPIGALVEIEAWAFVGGDES
jgi:2-iminobutanoate/2-iminopropanoate deaminase